MPTTDSGYPSAPAWIPGRSSTTSPVGWLSGCGPERAPSDGADPRPQEGSVPGIGETLGGLVGREPLRLVHLPVGGERSRGDAHAEVVDELASTRSIAVLDHAGLGSEIALVSGPFEHLPQRRFGEGLVLVDPSLGGGPGA